MHPKDWVRCIPRVIASRLFHWGRVRSVSYRISQTTKAKQSRTSLRVGVAIERYQGRWNPLAPSGIPLSVDAARVPLAADLSRKDFNGLLQARDSNGSLCLAFSASYLRLLLPMRSWTFPANKNPSVVLGTREGALRRDCNPSTMLFRCWKVY